ncbi:MAG: hypothetical protein AABZ25_01700 [Nitrospirota bacterium]
MHEKKSILNLGGIAKGRKVGFGKERDFAKKVISKGYFKKNCAE